MSQKIKLTSSDDQEFEVERNVIEISITIKNMLDEMMTDENDKGIEIPLPTIDSKTLEKIIAWCNHHKDDYRKIEQAEEEDRKKGKVIRRKLPDWDAEHLKLGDTKESKAFIFSILKAANYLDIHLLLNYTALVISTVIRGADEETVRKTFDLKPSSSYTDEQKKRVEAVLKSMNEKED